MVGPGVDLQHAESYPLALRESGIEQGLDQPSPDTVFPILGGDFDKDEEALIAVILDVEPADVGTVDDDYLGA
jgi:hypothetical protein